jgi:putative endonuclease
MGGKPACGASGERIAAEYMLLRGYRIVERNYRSGHFEVDLIAEKSGCLAFIEVKTRRSGSCGSAMDAVNERKLRNLRTGARLFLSKSTGPLRYREYRFDLIAIDLDHGRDRMVLNHLKGIT